MSKELHISSLIVHTRPARFEEVSAAIQKRGGEIAISDPCGKFVVVIETDHERKVTSFANELAIMPGVLSANLVFHQVDSFDDAAQEPVVNAGAKLHHWPE